MGNSIWGPSGAHMDVPRWVPDESLLQNPHRSHMGCPYRTHIITHLGPHSLLAEYYSNTLHTAQICYRKACEKRYVYQLC